MSDFVHLHNHTEFSLLDGLSKIPDFIAKAKQFNMDSLAITDHGTMYGTIQFYLEAKKQNVKPIIGCEMYIAPRSMYDSDPNLDRRSAHIVLLAKNEAGYKNLIKLVTKAHLEGFYYKPRIDFSLLSQHHEGLIGLSACLNGVINQPLMTEQYDEAEKKAGDYQELLGKGNFYLEIQKHRLEKQDIANKRIVALSDKMGIPLVATNDIHYLNPEDAEAQEILLCIQTQKTLLDKDRPLSMINIPDFYFRNPTEMKLLFHEFPEAIQNSVKIAESCNLTIPIGKMIMPVFPLPEGKTYKSFLREKSYEGAKIRLGEITDTIEKRLNYELEVIDSKGYSAYFLIVSDFVTWAKEQKIAVGPGRGSAAGSLVSYCMRITDVNPLTYNIPFERFLNPERPSPPDVDLDFEDKRRDEIITYITQKYGADHAAQVITFGKMEARAAVRDVGRVLGMPYTIPDRIAKLIPQGSSIEEALGQVAELKEAAREAEITRLLKLARKVEGVSRHASTHAAALVVSDTEITNYVPLTRESKGERAITQYDMYSLDLNVSEQAIGLLKFDLLGLRNLTTLSRCVKLVKRNQGVDIDLLSINLEDKAVYDLISSGETMGVFQMESPGMRRVARDLQPTTFMDIAALIALYRPGPMELIPQFVESKHDAAKIHYPHDDLKDILSESYGIPLYQEQVMLIASKMGGYTLGEADKLRKAMGKKKKEIMKKERIKFIEGSVKKGYKRKTAEDVFDMMERFAGYGFGKAHSVSYATITYQTAYMKTHFQIEFMTALLTAESHNKEKLAVLINESNRMGLHVLPPDVNNSYKQFAIDGKNIRFGLAGIKNVGEGAIASIIENRQSGPYKSLNDFCKRIDLGAINKRVLESLIKSGACDFFGGRASQLMALEQIMEQVQSYKKQTEKGMMGLFEGEETMMSEVPLPKAEEFDEKQKLLWEKELMGIYLSSHPLQQVLSELDLKRTHTIGEFDVEEHTGMNVIIGGIITDIRKILTKKNNSEMAFVKLEDETGTIEIVVFPKTFGANKLLWRKDQMIVVTGKVDNKDDTLKLIADEGKLLSEAVNVDKEQFKKDQISKVPDRVKEKNLPKKSKAERKPEVVDIVLPYEITLPDGFGREKLMKLYGILQKYEGEMSVVLRIPDKTSYRLMKLPLKIQKNKEVDAEIEELLT